MEGTKVVVVMAVVADTITTTPNIQYGQCHCMQFRVLIMYDLLGSYVFLSEIDLAQASAQHLGVIA